MDSNVTERNDIAPFYLGVRLSEGRREAGRCFTDHRQFLERGSFMQFTRQEYRRIYAFHKSLNHATSFEDVVQVQVFTPHRALGRWLKYAHG